ncbi:MAG: hypothetical protein LBC10_00975 [Deltaproteobacteria bacterium]|jgi:3-hydroxymyristoyl/3-hydroxydecanoyl-(acyl carrier protein) dehydratase|nr:hypothetical protein [Deltaproteobacteria bacterium]
MNSLCLAVQRAMVRPPEPSASNVMEADFFFGPDFAGFDGHFPGDPILPGIAQFMAVVLTAHPDGRAKLLQVGRTKFLNLVRPGDTVHVRATLRDTHAGVQVSGECATRNGVCAQIKILLAG